MASAKRASRTPIATVALIGLFGHSEDSEKRRVYFSAQLNSYAEFRAADVVRYDDVAAADSPIPGEAATRVTLKRGSPVAFTHTWSESLRADDQFDLDVRVETVVPSVPVHGYTRYWCVRDTLVCTRTMLPTENCAATHGFNRCAVTADRG